MSDRVVLFARVSTIERQDPETQLDALRAVARRFGWEIVEEIALKLSAWDEDSAREVQRRALAPIEEGRADVLAVWGFDRLHRGGIPSAFALLRRLEDHLGARLYSLQEPFLSTATLDPQTRELMIAFHAWVAKWESQRRSERLKAKANTKRHRAEAGGGRAYWGRGRMPTSIDVSRIRELRDAGKTIRAIASELDLSIGTVHNVLHVHSMPDERSRLASPVHGASAREDLNNETSREHDDPAKDVAGRTRSAPTASRASGRSTSHNSSKALQNARERVSSDGGDLDSR